MTQPTHPPVKKRRLQAVLFSLLIGLLLMQGVLLLVLVPFTAYLREQAAWQQQQDLRVESAADEIRTFVQEQIHQLDLIDSMPAAYFRDDPDLLGSLLAIGLTMLLSLQAITHMGVVLGLVPTQGMPLPFISYGGSAFTANCIAVGLLMSIARSCEKRMDRNV